MSTAMSEQEQRYPDQWLLRCKGVKHGPYPAASVRRKLLRGELELSDEISRDGRQWQQILHVADVVPLQLRALLGEKQAGRLFAHRVHSGHEREDALSTPLSPVVILALVAGLLSLLGVALWFGVPPPVDPPRCDAPPGPGVNWRNCVLAGVDVGSASLQGANLNSTILRGAHLTATNLEHADLRYANLTKADLAYALLSGASLMGADLRGADLSHTDLRGADLRFADLSGASLAGAQLQDAHFDQALWLDGKPCLVGSKGKCLR
ncbi:hypothetical protein QQ73_18310 [Candidatus Endoriftia persephone str. Guaymas]|nr:hypothetical protein [Candidatus Endoriftia persephone str. Guaymas]